MGEVFESDIETDFRHFPFARPDKGARGFQSAADNPFLRSQVAYFFEVTLERGKAAPCVIGNFL